MPLKRPVKKWTKRILKTIGATLLALVLFVVLLVGAFIVTPEFHLPTKQIATFAERFAPEAIKLQFTEFQILVQRPKGKWLAKRVVIDTEHFCIRYEGEAVTACLDEFHLAATFSADGIDSIEPIRLVGVNANVDLPKFPRSEKKSEGGFDTIGFLRKQILPKWNIDDSRIEISRVAIWTAPKVGYTASLDLKAGKDPGEIDVTLHDFRALGGPLFAKADVKIVRPASWGGARETKEESNQWKIGLNGLVSLDKRRRLTIDGDANVYTFRDLDTRLRVSLEGIKPLREGRLEAKLAGSAADGLLSLKFGAAGAQMRALDFVNCDWKANLDKETGSLHCGPDSVRLVVKEQSFLRRPDLFTFRPVFDLNVNRLYFGDVKGADVDLDLKLDHRDFISFATKVDGTFRKSEGPAKYSAKGSVSLALQKFSSLVTLLRETPYSVPAPLNVLDGRVEANSQVDLSDGGGEITYRLTSGLDSPNQALHFHVDGSTRLTPQGPKHSLHPATDVTVVLDRIRLSAPRFDLRAPPPMKPDSRFGPIEKPREVATAEAKSQPADFKLRIKTAQPEALKIATNLTKTAIPLSLDVLYNGRVVTEKVGPNSSPVSGWVVVGRTPVDLFKRNAVLEEMRVDLLSSGDNRVNGRVSVSYLEYTIQMLVMGAMREPHVRFYSEPPLDDDQIVSVLLFGRPSHELGEDEKTSVASLNAALTDAVLSVSSLYLLASTPVESVGYDPEKGRVTARVGLGGGTSLELGGGGKEQGSGVGIRKRLTQDILFRSEVETLGTTGKRTLSALVEWVKKF